MPAFRRFTHWPLTLISLMNLFLVAVGAGIGLLQNR
jgi:hypothetical protein